MRALRVSAGVVLVLLLIPVAVTGIVAGRIERGCDRLFSKGRELAEEWLFDGER